MNPRDIPQHPDQDLAGYALRTLPLPELHAVERHLAGCPACAAELRELESVAELMAFLPEPATSSPRTKAALMQRIQARPARAPVSIWRRRVGPIPLDLAASFAAALVLGAGGMLAYTAWQAGSAAPSASVASGPIQLGADPGRRAAFRSADGASSATITLDSGGQRALVEAAGLAPLPGGAVYQLWLWNGEARVSAGFFAARADGTQTLDVRAPQGLGSFGGLEVTIEPAGGSAKPTGPRVLGGPF